ncbi:MAG: hypothetical protein M3352_05000, partial [Bacteroidota bacterium]|nr:hypothetical protein [Bacteroidota bacterium]
EKKSFFAAKKLSTNSGRWGHRPRQQELRVEREKEFLCRFYSSFYNKTKNNELYKKKFAFSPFSFSQFLISILK